jgi:hypothetical protein
MARACGPTASGGWADAYGYNTSTGGTNVFGACIHENDDWILYQPAVDTYPFVGLSDYINHGTYNYYLQDLATSPIWQDRHTWQTMFTGTSLGLGHNLDGGEFFMPAAGTGEANPPWAWYGGPGSHFSFAGWGGYWYNFGVDGTAGGQGLPNPWPNFLAGELLIAPQDAARRFFPNYSAFDEAVTFSEFYPLNPPPPPPDFTVSVNGPDVVWTGHYASWSAAVSGGTPPYTYQWTGQNMGSSTQDNFSGYVYYPFTIYLDVWDASGGHLAVTKSVTTCDSGPNDC